MNILLINGQIVTVVEAKSMRENNHGKQYEVLGPRNRVLATFAAANIVGWWWNNEDVTVCPASERREI